MTAPVSASHVLPVATSPGSAPIRAGGFSYSTRSTWPRKITAALSAACLHVAALAGPVSGHRSQPTSAGHFGHARTTLPRARPDAARQLRLILIERKLLIRQIAQNQRRHRATYSAAKRLREITHQQLKLELTNMGKL